ncbi:MAG TPA: phage major capsid protein [Thermomicrobiales bacterium]|jgi:hypothetical protein|nr:phage major capsid protein [Thermomicrobiales bacterium]
MALTKIEAAKLTNDLLLRGVIETIVRESEVLTHLPFTDVTGTAITYNRETTMPPVAFLDVGDTWTEATPTWTPVTASLRILGGDADVDDFLQKTYANPNDLEAEVIANRAKAVAHAYSDAFYHGSADAGSKSFDGLARLATAGQTLSAGASGGPLTLDLMDELVDRVRPGKPHAILLSKRSRRSLSALRRGSGNLLETDVDAFGRRALFYDGIPLLVDDFIRDDETIGASGPEASSIYAVRFGSDGVSGLEHGGVQVEPIGALESKNAMRWRIRWYCGLAVYSDLGVARLTGVTP